MATDHAIGIDIGGTGIKGAVVDLGTGELVSERLKVKTPEGGRPKDMLKATEELVDQIDAQLSGSEKLPLGVCFPAIVKRGYTLSAANISDEWIGLQAEDLFEQALGREIHFINDADAAGFAEVRYGAAAGVDGLVILTTLGTGIGSALIYDGVLVPNTELGHLEIGGEEAEHRASGRAESFPTPVNSSTAPAKYSATVSRNVRRSRERVGAAHAVRDGRGGPGRVRRSARDHAHAPESSSSAGRFEPVRPGQSGRPRPQPARRARDRKSLKGRDRRRPNAAGHHAR